jgi:hypothetical protein
MVPNPALPPPTKEDSYDIPPIVGFNPNFAIGRNAETFGAHDVSGDPDDSGRVVLLIRGELLRRYPTADIYAVRSDWAPNTPFLDRDPVQITDEASRVANEKRPIFRGTLNPDVTFFGFDLTIDQARGGNTRNEPAGWYFVIQQQPFDPRFGLDAAEFPTDGSAPTVPPLVPAQEDGEPVPGASKWDALNWIHLAGTPPSATTLAALKNIHFGVPLNGADPASEWGRNSSNMAEITWQLPVRILIHAQDMLAEG